MYQWFVCCDIWSIWLFDSIPREFHIYSERLSNLFLLCSLQEHGKHLESADYGEAHWIVWVWGTQRSGCIYARLENEYGGEPMRVVSLSRTLTSLSPISPGFLGLDSLVYSMVMVEYLLLHTGNNLSILEMKWVSYPEDDSKAVRRRFNCCSFLIKALI